MVEFINLCQGGMNVHEYSLKFTKILKYAPCLVPILEINELLCDGGVG